MTLAIGDHLLIKRTLPAESIPKEFPESWHEYEVVPRSIGDHTVSYFQVAGETYTMVKLKVVK